MDEDTKEIVASNLTIAYYVAEAHNRSDGIRDAGMIVHVYMEILEALNEKLPSAGDESDYERL